MVQETQQRRPGANSTSVTPWRKPIAGAGLQDRRPFSRLYIGMTRSHREGKATPPRHDPGYKGLFSHPKMVKELLRGFLQGEWIEKLDFSSLERMSNSFVSDDLRERQSDVIWRVRLEGEQGGWVYLYLLLEFQSTSDPFMAVRVLTYVSLLLEDIIRKEGLKPGDRLPVVLPLVLHNGKGRWRAPVRLESLFVSVPKELRRYLPKLTYLLLDERRLDLGRPDLERNPAAALFRFETNATAEALPALYQDLNDLLPPEEQALRRTIHAWITAVVRRAIPDVIIPEGVNLEEASMLEETLIEWREKIRKEARKEARKEGLRARQQGRKEGRKEGREEGREEGRQEGRKVGRQEGRKEGRVLGLRKVLLQQMTLRFGRLPKNVRSQVEQMASTQELEKLTRKVLSASSLEEMGLR
jgi:predicted transposase YdaD